MKNPASMVVPVPVYHPESLPGRDEVVPVPVWGAGGSRYFSATPPGWARPSPCSKPPASAVPKAWTWSSVTLKRTNALRRSALLDGLEIIPRKTSEYRGITLTEMDVDAVRARHPRLALVDELAHTNASGSRHPKRYQDVDELLSAGIDVYTTLNIQHLASLNDAVAQITGTIIRETIPDSVIDEAAEIELIDLPPDELLQRLDDGKVYIPEQAARAIEEFFRKGNLTALREMALRRAAERVDDQMRAYMRTRAIPGPWQAAERLLVCISPDILGERLVRSTRRLADELNAGWFAVYVETPEHEHFPSSKRDQIASTLRLAEELGARSKILPLSQTAPGVAGTILQYARKHNVTKIVAGKPLRPVWQDWVRGSIVEQAHPAEWEHRYPCYFQHRK